MSENQEKVVESAEAPQASNVLASAANCCNAVAGNGLCGMIAKLICAVVAVISILILVNSGCNTLTYDGEKIVVPTYEKYKEQNPVRPEVTDEMMREIEKKYADDIIAMVKVFNPKDGQDKQAREDLQKMLAKRFDEDQRDDFMDGLTDFVEEMAKDVKELNKDKKDFKLTMDHFNSACQIYVDEWQDAMKTAKRTKSDSYVQKQSRYYWGVFREGMLLLLLAAGVGMLVSINGKLKK